ncbi:MogA/MoaB family molybdenum cofactor biosynthesis protein [Luteococcus sanguinis]|uniref:Molybdenum cofactor biosynthesis protein B n=1 Tax=Luteococcus sanguinis TaxID=174038 RepID=A0ABW1X1I0_9ACTN
MSSCVVVTVSDRVSTGQAEDRSGPLLVDWLTGCGHEVQRVVVPDGDAVADAVRSAAEGGAALVLTTGGTGITPRDLTPQVVAPLLDVEIPGIIELVRRVGVDAGVVGAPLTRGVAGIIDGEATRTVVVTLPGSPGGVRDAISVLHPLLDHLLDQARDGDH